MIEKFPKIAYPISTNDDGETTYKALADISHHLRLSADSLNSIVNYDKQILQSGEGLEISAGENYDRTDLYYILELANDRFDWKESRPLTSMELDSYISEKYLDRNGIHHYENEYGNEVDNTFGVNSEHVYPQKIIPITNYEYEESLNDKRRAIKVVKPTQVKFVEELVKEKISEMK